MLYQEQKAVFTQQMLKSLSILQMNKLVLDLYLKKASDTNPLIKSNSYTPILPNIIEETLKEEKKIFDHLREELFLDLEEHEWDLVHLLLGNLNSKGFLTQNCVDLCKNTSLDASRLEFIRTKIQQSSYLGLCSYNSEEYLLFISSHIYGINSLEYQLVHLLNKKKKLHLPILKKQFSGQNVELALENLKKFPVSPLAENTIAILPDFSVKTVNSTLQIIPIVYQKFIIQTDKLEEFQSLYSQKELTKFHNEAKTLQKMLELRSSTLQKHAETLIVLRKDFFFKEESEKTVSLKDIADITGRHVSTVSRTFKNRYFIFENQIYPFSILWSHKVGDTPDYKVKELIKKIIEIESSPMSDQMITDILNRQGVKISRRTVAKYRKNLQIGSKHQR